MNATQPAEAARSVAPDCRAGSHYLIRVVQSGYAAALTGGKVAILLMPTMPARAERRHMQDPFADACRSLAKEMPVSLFDLHNIFAALKGADYEAKFSDKCHFNEDGHAFIAAQIADYLDRQ